MAEYVVVLSVLFLIVSLLCLGQGILLRKSINLGDEMLDEIRKLQNKLALYEQQNEQDMMNTEENDPCDQVEVIDDKADEASEGA
jgi:hypothetical protein